ncbi:MAG: ABC transporter permease, partial [Butyricicoccus sp.]
NYLLGFGGFLVLAAAYYIAVSIESPLSALSWFFIAVGMVIVATYALFISGSVVLCRILQKNKRYYYKKNHFVAVSSMAYRMKRNGAGLASVCILSTMVLVMMVGSSCLYFGAEDSLKSMYPKDINLSMRSESIDDVQTGAITELEEQMAEVLAAHQTKPENLESYCTIALTGMLNNGFLETDSSTVNGILESYSNVCQVYFLSLADYNRCMGTHETLQPGQAMIYCIRTTYEEKTLDVSGCYSLEIVKHLDSMIRYEDEAAYVDIVPSIYLVVPDLQAVTEPLNRLATFSGEFALRPLWNYSFDTDLPEAEEIALAHALGDQLEAINAGKENARYRAESRAANRADFYSTYGSLFFLGILLTIVFLFATVLILYYKQITEGYEDASRFEIMQKVGMTKTDIRKSVNSQMLTVFFLPLVTAVVHLGFAFPLVRKLLLLFHLTNLTLLLIVTAITVLIFAIFYGLVYSITARTYYTIVAGGDTAA